MGDKKTILIVGRSGNGKTSLAKTISGRTHILNEYDNISDSYLHVKQYDGTRYNVLVCSCIGDNEEDALSDFDKIERVAEETIDTWGKGRCIDAFVFAMKYGVRYTKQESDAVDIVKRLFGEDVFRKRVVIAFSYGDIFDNDKDMETQQAFNEWCKQQQGSIRKLFEDVNYRCVLFDNKAKHHDESLSQLQSFILEINPNKAFEIQVVPNKALSTKFVVLDEDQRKKQKSQDKKLQKKPKDNKLHEKLENQQKDLHRQHRNELLKTHIKDEKKLAKKHTGKKNEIKNKHNDESNNREVKYEEGLKELHLTHEKKLNDLHEKHEKELEELNEQSEQKEKKLHQKYEPEQKQPQEKPEERREATTRQKKTNREQKEKTKE